MSYEVDQSNKIENSGDTALALSNDKEYTIRIPGREKRAAMAYLILHFAPSEFISELTGVKALAGSLAAKPA